MGSVDEYLESLPAGPARAELERLAALITQFDAELGQGVSYGMPCFTYRGKPLVALVSTNKHLAWYPYSGQIIRDIPALASFDQSPGTLRFSADSPIPDDAARQLLVLRAAQIDQQLGSR
ncbi:MAG TPA: DUF1801 domain-containing protein [Microbacteriaceae bacterium]|nr:DUF1801 domain-containing protein [Microbacteriaceae bacterium]